MAFGADSVETASRRGATSGGLDDLVGSEAARADAQPTDSAVDHRANPLEVRFEPPRRDVVRVADVPADDGAFSADFAALCHELSLLVLEGRPRRHKRWIIARPPGP